MPNAKIDEARELIAAEPAPDPITREHLSTWVQTTMQMSRGVNTDRDRIMFRHHLQRMALAVEKLEIEIETLEP